MAATSEMSPRTKIPTLTPSKGDRRQEYANRTHYPEPQGALPPGEGPSTNEGDQAEPPSLAGKHQVIHIRGSGVPSPSYCPSRSRAPPLRRGPVGGGVAARRGSHAAAPRSPGADARRELRPGVTAEPGQRVPPPPRARLAAAELPQLCSLRFLSLASAGRRTPHTHTSRHASGLQVRGDQAPQGGCPPDRSVSEQTPPRSASSQEPRAPNATALPLRSARFGACCDFYLRPPEVGGARGGAELRAASWEL